MQRLLQIGNHLTVESDNNNKGDSTYKKQNDDDVVIVGAYRTALTKAGKGSFKDINSDEILYKLLIEFFKKIKIDTSIIGDVAVGNVLNPGAGVNEHRAAVIASGIPSTVPFIALNRQCSSGLMAVNDIANKILTGQITCGLACGVESMSNNYGPQAAPKISKIIQNSSNDAKNCLLPMGNTSENVNERYNIDRLQQDEFAANSYQKAEKAVLSGLFKDEILPIEVKIEIEEEEEEDDDDNDNDTKSSKFKTIKVDQDEGPRKNVTASSLNKIKPAFKKDGASHAGNSSQVSDGAAAILLMTRKLAKSLNLKIIGKYIATTNVGVPPDIMGIGPAVAIPKLLSMCELSINDISVFEINEAFAGQALYSIKSNQIDLSKVNPRGGAIALGHPLGCTGARQLCTLMRELNSGEYGVVSMCIGGGQGAASLFLKE
ncbi:3-ketoacyl-CoA thiolase with broad chain length specificity [Pichia californica]|nr:3-ketoacyl-CoA thiolase with broad chain length specificity [[Candida] californica]